MLAQNYDEYKYRNVVVTVKAGNSILSIKGILYDVIKQKKKVFYENETFYNEKRDSSLTREVDKQYLIIRYKRSEYMIDVDNVICVEVKKW